MTQLRSQLPKRSSSEITGENARVLKALEKVGNDLTIVKLLANSPNVFVPYVQMSNALLNRAALPARQRELVILWIATRLDNSYEWAEHMRMSAAAGVTDDERQAIRARDIDSDLFDEDDQRALRLAGALHADEEVDPEEWEAAASAWGAEGVLDLVVTVGWWGGFVPVVIGALGLVGSDAVPVTRS